MQIQQYKDDAMKLGILFASLFGIFQIAFFKESVFVNLRIVFALFYLFIIPGFILMLYWREKLGFVETAVGGSIIAAALFIMYSYYGGLLGLNAFLTTITFPFLTIGGYFIANTLLKKHGKP